MSDSRPPATLTPALLRRLRLLSLLDDAQLQRILSHARLVHHPRRTTVVMKGRGIDYLGFLVVGKLQVLDVLPDGKEFGLNLIEEGQFFGELSVIDLRPRSASVIALTPVTVVQIPGDVARDIFYHVPAVARALMEHLAATVRRMSELRALQSLPHAHQRVYALLDYIKREEAGGQQVIDDMPTHQSAAIMINTSRETVTRALARLKAAGVIRQDLRRLVIRQPDALRRLLDDPSQLSP